MAMIALVLEWLWCRRLAGKPGAPRFVRWLPKALLVWWVLGMAVVALDLAAVYRQSYAGAFDPAFKSRMLADGIADAMNVAAWALIPFVLAVPALSWTTWRLRTR